MSNTLTHLDQTGAANMVDVADKDHTTRVAVAQSCVTMAPETLELIVSGNAKNDCRVPPRFSPFAILMWINKTHSNMTAVSVREANPRHPMRANRRIGRWV